MSLGQHKFKNHVIGFSFVAPYLLFAVAFSFIPIIMIFKLSFQSGSLLNFSSLHWVGFQNFKMALTNGEYLRALGNNFLYIILSVPFCQLFALTLALLLRKKSKANAFFESVYFIPLLISMVSASVIISYVLSMRGPLNYVLDLFHISPINWFGNPTLARISVVILELWKGCTFYVFIYLAALRALPGEYLDAAKIDGANMWQEIFRVTIPLIKNSILVSVVVTTIFQFQLFESIYMLTGGGPLNSTESLVFGIYRATFIDNNVGVGSALSIILLLIIIIISLIQMKLLKSDHEYGG